MVLTSRSDENNPNDEGTLDRRPQAAEALQDSDSEPDLDDPVTEGAANGGYSLLPQSLGSESDLGDGEDEEFPQLGDGGYLVDLAQPPHEWQPSEYDLRPDHNRDLHLDDEQIAKIKKAMEKINLPVAARPPWAAQISDDEWNTRLQELVARSKKPQREEAPMNGDHGLTR
ncbi:hypothetical protein BIW11_06880 [Tropilaelaps mercedesae]|uniref:Male-enhanced antigen 1 n=1 Tax=Tropilaelaps mercedesae TaxID=418985 RepID=A0A1V9XWC2_9ACAR|nr:hypothetical protein BIW11_06880 [Tropilaelaps mercedesae]